MPNIAWRYSLYAKHRWAIFSLCQTSYYFLDVSVTEVSGFEKQGTYYGGIGYPASGFGGIGTGFQRSWSIGVAVSVSQFTGITPA